MKFGIGGLDEKLSGKSNFDCYWSSTSLIYMKLKRNLPGLSVTAHGIKKNT